LIKDPITRAWAQHKKTSWILSGLNQNFTSMNALVFCSIQRQTNMVEAVHRRTHFLGSHQALLPAIQDAHRLDTGELGTCEQAKKSNVPPVWRNRSTLARMQQNDSRQ
ncbi:MAG: hypothetical protein M1823_006460, partial [Watsoniomyces obsoletus]